MQQRLKTTTQMQSRGYGLQFNRGRSSG